MSDDDYKNKISPILNRLSILEELKVYNEYYIYRTNKYILFNLVDKDEKERINDLMVKNINPFPGLIKSDEIDTQTAFTINNSYNYIISYCTIHGFCINLGKDSTIIIDNHNQSIDIINYGIYKYKLKLCIIISFGDTINENNHLYYLEDLISYYLKIKKGG